MSLAAIVPRLIWEGDGLTGMIELSDGGEPIPFSDDAYIKVQQKDDDDLVTSLTQGVHYNLSLSSVDPGSATAAVLTRIGGNLPDGYFWAIYRENPIQQSGEVDQGGDFSSSEIEDMLDAMGQQIQELADRIGRAPIASRFTDLDFDATLPPLEAGKAIIVNNNVDGFDLASLAGIELEIGTVTTGAAGTSAAAAIVGTPPTYQLDLTIPRGNTGAAGAGSGDMLTTANLSDVANAATAFANIKQAATTSATGVAELATDVEAQAKADTGRVLTPSNLAALVASLTMAGLVERATDTEAAVGSDTDRYISAAQLHESRADVASATTCDIGAAASNFLRITGTTTITGLGTAPDGVWRDVTFAAALILTHNATSLILPGSANITTAANDRMKVRSLGSGNWIVLHYTKASGEAVVSGTGKLIARNYATYTSNADLSTAIPYDDTIPQSGEGTEVVTVSITPSSITNRVRVRFTGFFSGATNVTSDQVAAAALFRDSETNALAAVSARANVYTQIDCSTSVNVGLGGVLTLEFEHVPATLSTVTYKIRVGPNTGTIRMNGTTSARRFGGVAAASLIVEEFVP